MGKIKVIKKSTLSGRTENDDYKIYPVTKTDAVFTDGEDIDECDTKTPQGANKTAKEIFNSMRKKGWVNNERIKDGAVTKDKVGGDALKQLNDNSATLEDVVKHVYPRILMNEDDLNALIEKGGPFEEGMDYLAYEDNS